MVLTKEEKDERVKAYNKKYYERTKAERLKKIWCEYCEKHITKQRWKGHLKTINHLFNSRCVICE